jgi:hypothetical protein
MAASGFLLQRLPLVVAKAFTDAKKSIVPRLSDNQDKF